MQYRSPNTIFILERCSCQTVYVVIRLNTIGYNGVFAPRPGATLQVSNTNNFGLVSDNLGRLAAASECMASIKSRQHTKLRFLVKPVSVQQAWYPVSKDVYHNNNYYLLECIVFNSFSFNIKILRLDVHLLA